MSNSERVTGAGETGKLPYRRPKLVIYGSVRSLTGAKSGTNTGDSATPMKMNSESDRSLKENIVRVGEHPRGFGLYLFDYKPEFRSSLGLAHSRQFGVMADEIEGVVPGAVSVGSHGFKVVNYGKLGIVRH